MTKTIYKYSSSSFLGATPKLHKASKILIGVFLAIILILSLLPPGSSTATIVENHRYFINDNFENSDAADEWSANGAPGVRGYLPSSTSTKTFSLKNWDGVNNIYLKFVVDEDQSLNPLVSFFTSSGMRLGIYHPTQNEPVDVTQSFIGYRDRAYSFLDDMIPGANDESYASFVEDDMYVEITGHTAYLQLKLYSDDYYSLTDDPQFGGSVFELSMSSRGNPYSDAPVMMADGVKTRASQLTIDGVTPSLNARSFTIYDSIQNSMHSLTGAGSYDAAGSRVSLPYTPYLSLEYGAVISSEHFIDYSKIEFRLHFLLDGVYSISDETAITAFQNFAASANNPTNFVYDNIDFSQLSGLSGKFTVEIRNNILYGASPVSHSDIKFILLDLRIQDYVSNEPVNIASEFNAGLDYVHRDPETRVIGNLPNYALTSQKNGYLSTYLIDTSTDLIDIDFSLLDEGTFKQNYATGMTEGFSQVDFEDGKVVFASPPSQNDRVIYQGHLMENGREDFDIDFFSRNVYSFAIDISPTFNKTQGGLALQQRNDPDTWVSYELDTNVHRDNDEQYVNVYSISISGSSYTKSLVYQYDIKPLMGLSQFSFDYSSMITLAVVFNSGSAQIFLYQDGQSIYLGNPTYGHVISDIGGMGLVGDYGAVSTMNVDTIDQEWFTTLYLEAKNLGDGPVTFTFTQNHPYQNFTKTLGSVTVPANSPTYETYPIKLEDDFVWRFMDRIQLSASTTSGDPYYIRSLSFDTFWNMGETIDLTRYYTKHNDVEVRENSLYFDQQQYVTRDEYSDEMLGFDASFENTEGSEAFTNILATGEVNAIRSTSITQVKDGIASIQLLGEANSDTRFTLPIDLSLNSINVDRITLPVNIIRLFEDEFLEISIKNNALSYNELIRRFEGSSANNFGSTSVDTSSGSSTGTGWNEISFLTSSLDRAADGWYLDFFIHSDRTNNQDVTVYFDEFKAETTDQPNILASYPVFLSPGPLDFRLQGIADSILTNNGYLFPLYQIGLRPFGSTDEFQFIGNELQLKASSGLSTVSETSTYMDVGRKFELAIAYVNDVDMSGLKLEIETLSLNYAQSSSLATDYDGATSHFQGLQYNFDGGTSKAIDQVGRIKEHVSFKRSVFVKNVGHTLSPTIRSDWSFQTGQSSSLGYTDNYGFESLVNSIPGDYDPGWDILNHPNAVLVENWTTGYNGGVPSPSDGYHAYYVANEGIGNSVALKFNNLNSEIGQPGRWLGSSHLIENDASLLNWEIGDEITISLWQKSLNYTGARVGLYHYENGTTSFGSAMSSTFVAQELGIWEKHSVTFTIDANWDMTGYVSLYVYGYFGDEGVFWVDDVSITQEDENNLSGTINDQTVHTSISDPSLWSSPAIADFNVVNSQLQLQANSAMIGSEYIHDYAIHYLHPSEMNSWDLSIENIGWKVTSGERFKGFVSVYSGNSQLVQYGVFSNNDNIELWESITSLGEFYTIDSVYAPLLTSDRSIHLSYDDGITTLTVDMANELYTTDFTGHTPTHIVLEAFFHPEDVTTGLDPTYFGIGDITFETRGENLLGDGTFIDGLDLEFEQGSNNTEFMDIIPFTGPSTIQSDYALQFRSGAPTDTYYRLNQSDISSTGTFRLGAWVYVTGDYAASSGGFSIFNSQFYDNNSQIIANTVGGFPSSYDQWEYLTMDVSVSDIPASFVWDVGKDATHDTGFVYVTGLSLQIIDSTTELSTNSYDGLFATGSGNYTTHARVDTSISPFVELDTSVIGGDWFIEFISSTGNYTIQPINGISRLNAYILTSGATITDIIFYAPDTVSTLLIESFKFYGIMDTTLSFSSLATVDTVLYGIGEGLYSNLQGYSDEIVFEIDVTSWDVSLYPFFSVLTNSEGNVSFDLEAEIDGLWYVLGSSDSTIRGNFIQTGSTMTSLKYSLSASSYSEIFIDPFIVYDVNHVSFSTSTLDGISPSYDRSDYLDAYQGELIISTSASSDATIIFDDFNFGESRFIETITDFAGDGSMGLRFQHLDAGQSPVVNGINFQSGYEITRRNIDLTPDTTPILWIQIEGQTDVIINQVKFYTIDDWVFPTEFEYKDQVLYVDHDGNLINLYENFLGGEYSVANLPGYNNPVNPNIIGFDVSPQKYPSYELFDFHNNNENWSGTAFDSILTVTPNQSDQIIVSRPNIRQYVGNYFMIRARVLSDASSPIGSVYLDEVVSNSQIVWKGMSSNPVLIGNEWVTQVVDLSNSPVDVSGVWGRGSDVDFVFTNHYGSQLLDMEIEFMQLSPRATLDIHYYRDKLDIFDSIQGADTSISLDGLQLTADGSGDIDVIMSQNLPAAIINQIDQISITVSGSDTSYETRFGYDVLGDVHEFELLHNQDYTYTIINPQDFPSLFFTQDDGIVDTGVEIAIKSIVLHIGGVSWDATEVEENWMVDTGSETTQSSNTFTATGNAPSLAISSTVSPAIVNEHSNFQITLGLSNIPTSGVQIQLYDRDEIGAVALSNGEIYTVDQTVTAIINLDHYTFMTNPEIRVVSVDGSVLLNTFSVTVQSIKFNHGHSFTSLHNVDELSTDSHSYKISPVDTSQEFTTEYINTVPSESYNSIFLSMDTLFDVSVSFEVFAYDIYDKEHQLTLNDTLSMAYQLYSGENQILIPLQDDHTTNSEKLLIKISTSSPFGTNTFVFNAVTTYNTYQQMRQPVHLDIDNPIDNNESGLNTVSSNSGRHFSKSLKLSTSDSAGYVGLDVPTFVPGQYSISFFYKTLSSQNGEMLSVSLNSSSITTDYLDLSYAYDNWQQFSKVVNIHNKLSLDNYTQSFLLEFGLGTYENGSEVTNLAGSSILIHDARMSLVEAEQIVDQEYEIMSSVIPVFDGIVLPQAAGLDIVMRDESNDLMTVRFNPDLMTVGLYNDQDLLVEDLGPYIENINYRVSLLVDGQGIKIDIIEASIRADNDEYISYNTVINNDPKSFVLRPVYSNKTASALLQSFLDTTSSASGVEATGFFSIKNGAVSHTSTTYDDTFYLVDARGDRFISRDYMINFNYNVSSGYFIGHYPGVEVEIGAASLKVNGIDLSTEASNSGYFSIQLLDNTIEVWKDNVFLGYFNATATPDTFSFSGASLYSIYDVEVLLERETNYDQQFLVIEGEEEFTISHTLSTIGASWISFLVRQGTVNMYVDNTPGTNWNIEGVDQFSIEELTGSNQFTEEITISLRNRWSDKVKIGHIGSYDNSHARTYISTVVDDERLSKTGLYSEDEVTFMDETYGLERMAMFTDTGDLSQGPATIQIPQEFTDTKLTIKYLMYSDLSSLKITLAENTNGDQQYIELFYDYYYDYDSNNTYHIERWGFISTLTFVDTSTGFSQSYTNDDYTIRESPIAQEICQGSYCFEGLDEQQVNEGTTYSYYSTHEFEGFSSFEQYGYRGSFLGQLDIFSVGADYFVYTDGQLAVPTPAAFSRDSSSYHQPKVEVHNSGVYYLTLSEGSDFLPNGLKISNDSTTFMTDSKLYLLNNGYGSSFIKTEMKINPFEAKLPEFSVDFEFVGNHSNARVYITDDDKNIGAYITENSALFYSDADWSNDPLPEDAIFFDENPYGKRYYHVNINLDHSQLNGLDKLWNDGVSPVFAPSVMVTDPSLGHSDKDGYNPYFEGDILTEKTFFSSEDTENFYVYAVIETDSNALLSMESFKFGDTDNFVVTDNVNGDETEVVEISGQSANYAIAGLTTNTLKLSPGDGLSRDFFATGDANTTMEFAFDLFIPTIYDNNIESFTYNLLDDSSTSIARIYAKNHGIFLHTGGLPQRFGTLVDNQQVKITMLYDYSMGFVNATIDNEYAIDQIGRNSTHMLKAGDLLTTSITSHTSNPLLHSVYLDNIVTFGYDVETFPSTDITAPEYSIYNTFSGEITRDYDAGARYITVVAKSMGDDGYLIPRVNGVELEKKQLRTYNMNTYSSYIFYIPTIIDTSTLVSVSYHVPADDVRIHSMGFMKYVSPQSAFLVGEDYNNLDSTNSMLNTNDGTFNNLQGSESGLEFASDDDNDPNRFSYTSDGLILDINSRDFVTDNPLADEMPVVNTENIAWSSVLLDGSTKGELFDETPLLNPVSSDVSDASLLSLRLDQNSLNPFWLVIKVQIATNVFAGTSGDGLFDVFLLLEMGDTGEYQTFVDKGALYGSTRFYASNGGPNGLSEIGLQNQLGFDDFQDQFDYGWVVKSFPLQSYYMISMDELVSDYSNNIVPYFFETTMDQLKRLKTEGPSSVLDHDIYPLGFDYTEEPGCISDPGISGTFLGNPWRLTQDEYSCGSNYDYENNGIYLINDPSNFVQFSGNFHGFEAVGIHNNGVLKVQDIALHKDPRTIPTFPSDGVTSAYYEGLSTWQTAYAGMNGEFALHEYIDYYYSDATSAMLQFSLDSPQATEIFMKIGSNHPATLLVNDIILGSTPGGTDFDEDLNENIFTVPVAAGSNKITIMAIHPRDTEYTTSFVSTDKDGWVVSFEGMGDAGIDFSLVPENNPGMDLGYATQFNAMEKVMNEFYEHNNDARNAERFHSMLPLPGETFAIEGYYTERAYIDTVGANPDDDGIQWIDLSKSISRYTYETEREYTYANGTTVLLQDQWIAGGIAASTNLYFGNPFDGTDGRDFTTFDFMLHEISDLKYLYINQMRFENNGNGWECTTSCTQTADDFSISMFITDFDISNSVVTSSIDIDVDTTSNDYDLVRITIPMSEGFHTITPVFNYNYNDFLNVTQLEEHNRAKFALKVGTSSDALGLNPSPLGDSMQIITQPAFFDSQNTKSFNNPFSGFSSGGTNNPGVRFSPIQNSPEGTTVLNGYWYMTPSGPSVLKEFFIGEKTLGGSCDEWSNAEIPTLSYLYSFISVNPGTPSQASTIVEQVVARNFPDESDLPNGWEVASGNGGYISAIERDLASSVTTNAAFNLDDLGSMISVSQSDPTVDSQRLDFIQTSMFDLVVTSSGFMLTFNDEADIYMLDRNMHEITLDYVVPQIPMNASSTQAIANAAIPETMGEIELQSIQPGFTTLTSAFTYIYNNDVKYIQIASDDGLITIQPDTAYLTYDTPELSMNYHAQTGKLWSYQHGSYFATTMYQGMTTQWINPDYLLNSVQSEFLVSPNNEDAFEAMSPDLVHTTAGAMGQTMQASEPLDEDEPEEDKNNFFANVWGRMKEAWSNYVAPAVNSVVSVFSSIGRWIANGVRNIADWISNTAVYQWTASQVKIIIAGGRGVIESIGNWIGENTAGFLDFLRESEIFLLVCTAVWQAVTATLDFVMQTVGALFELLRDLILRPLQDIWNKVYAKANDFMVSMEASILEHQEENNDTQSFSQAALNFGNNLRDSYFNESDMTAYDVMRGPRDDSQPESLLDLGKQYENYSDTKLSDITLRILKYADMFNKAFFRFMLITLWAIIAGSAIGFEYTMSDVMGTEEFDSETHDSTTKNHLLNTTLGGIYSDTEIPLTRFSSKSVLRIDALIKNIGDSGRAREARVKSMEGMMDMFGLSYTYDTTPMGQVPTNLTKYSSAFDVIARPAVDEYGNPTESWMYLMPLSQDLHIPIGFSAALVGNNDVFQGLIDVVLESLLSSVDPNLSDTEIKHAIENGIPVGNSTATFLDTLDINQLLSIATIAKIVSKFGIGIIFALGQESTGFVGLDFLLDTSFGNADNNALQVGPGAQGMEDPYKTDEDGNPTEERKWHFGIGFTEGGWILFIEIVMNLVPGFSELMGLYQDVRDMLFADTILDKAFGAIMILPDLGAIGATQFVADTAKRSAKEAIEQGLEEGTDFITDNTGKVFLKEYKERLPKSLEFLRPLSEKLNKFGGGGAKGWFRTALAPLTAVWRVVFGGRTIMGDATAALARKDPDLAKKISNEFLTKQFNQLTLVIRKADGKLEELSRVAKLDGLANTGSRGSLPFDLTDEWVESFTRRVKAKYVDILGDEAKIFKKEKEQFERLAASKDEVSMFDNPVQSLKQANAKAFEGNYENSLEFGLENARLTDSIFSNEALMARAMDKTLEEVLGPSASTLFKALLKSPYTVSKFGIRSAGDVIKYAVKNLFKNIMRPFKYLKFIGEELISSVKYVIEGIGGHAGTKFSRIETSATDIFIDDVFKNMNFGDGIQNAIQRSLNAGHFKIMENKALEKNLDNIVKEESLDVALLNNRLLPNADDYISLVCDADSSISFSLLPISTQNFGDKCLDDITEVIISLIKKKAEHYDLVYETNFVSRYSNIINSATSLEDLLNKIWSLQVEIVEDTNNPNRLPNLAQKTLNELEDDLLEIYYALDEDVGYIFNDVQALIDLTSRINNNANQLNSGSATSQIHQIIRDALNKFRFRDDLSDTRMIIARNDFFQSKGVSNTNFDIDDPDKWPNILKNDASIQDANGKPSIGKLKADILRKYRNNLETDALEYLDSAEISSFFSELDRTIRTLGAADNSKAAGLFGVQSNTFLGDLGELIAIVDLAKQTEVELIRKLEIDKIPAEYRLLADADPQEYVRNLIKRGISHSPITNGFDDVIIIPNKYISGVSTPKFRIILGEAKYRNFGDLSRITDTGGTFLNEVDFIIKMQSMSQRFESIINELNKYSDFTDQDLDDLLVMFEEQILREIKLTKFVSDEPRSVFFEITTDSNEDYGFKHISLDELDGHLTAGTIPSGRVFPNIVENGKIDLNKFREFDPRHGIPGESFELLENASGNQIKLTRNVEVDGVMQQIDEVIEIKSEIASLNVYVDINGDLKYSVKSSEPLSTEVDFKISSHSLTEDEWISATQGQNINPDGDINFIKQGSGADGSTDEVITQLLHLDDIRGEYYIIVNEGGTARKVYFDTDSYSEARNMLIGLMSGNNDDLMENGFTKVTSIISPAGHKTTGASRDAAYGTASSLVKLAESTGLISTRSDVGDLSFIRYIKDSIIDGISKITKGLKIKGKSTTGTKLENEIIDVLERLLGATDIVQLFRKEMRSNLKGMQDTIIKNMRDLTYKPSIGSAALPTPTNGVILPNGLTMSINKLTFTFNGVKANIPLIFDPDGKSIWRLFDGSDYEKLPIYDSDGVLNPNLFVNDVDVADYIKYRGPLSASMFDQLTDSEKKEVLEFSGKFSDFQRSGNNIRLLFQPAYLEQTKKMLTELEAMSYVDLLKYIQKLSQRNKTYMNYHLFNALIEKLVNSKSFDVITKQGDEVSANQFIFREISKLMGEFGKSKNPVKISMTLSWIGNLIIHSKMNKASGKLFTIPTRFYQGKTYANVLSDITTIGGKAKKRMKLSDIFSNAVTLTWRKLSDVIKFLLKSPGNKLISFDDPDYLGQADDPTGGIDLILETFLPVGKVPNNVKVSVRAFQMGKLLDEFKDAWEKIIKANVQQVQFRGNPVDVKTGQIFQDGTTKDESVTLLSLIDALKRLTSMNMSKTGQYNIITFILNLLGLLKY